MLPNVNTEVYIFLVNNPPPFLKIIFFPPEIMCVLILGFYSLNWENKHIFLGMKKNKTCLFTFKFLPRVTSSVSPWIRFGG